MYKCILGRMANPGLLLRAWRTKQELSQSQLAELLDCHQTTICRAEKGKTRLDLSTAIELAKVSAARGAELPVSMWVSCPREGQ